MAESRRPSRPYRSRNRTKYTSNGPTISRSFVPSAASRTYEPVTVELLLKSPKPLDRDRHDMAIQRLLPDHRILLAQEKQQMPDRTVDGRTAWLYHLEVYLLDEDAKDSLITHMRTKPHGDELALLDDSSDMKLESGEWYFKNTEEVYPGRGCPNLRRRRAIQPTEQRVNPNMGTASETRDVVTSSSPHAPTNSTKQDTVKKEPSDIPLHERVERPRGEKKVGATDAEAAVKNPTRSMIDKDVLPKHRKLTVYNFVLDRQVKEPKTSIRPSLSGACEESGGKAVSVSDSGPIIRRKREYEGDAEDDSTLTSVDASMIQSRNNTGPNKQKKTKDTTFVKTTLTKLDKKPSPVIDMASPVASMNGTSLEEAAEESAAEQSAEEEEVETLVVGVCAVARPA